MNQSQTVRAFVEALQGDDRKKFLASYGGGDDPYSKTLDSLDDPKNERTARDKIKMLFSVELLTTAERQEALARQTDEDAAQAAKRQEELSKLSAEATARQAQAAEEANRIAHQANEIAVHANATANRSLRVSWWNMAATAVATITAIAALIVSLTK